MILRRAWMTMALAVAAMLGQGASAQTIDRIVHAGTLIDGTGAAPRRDVSILISGEKIVSVEPGKVTRPGAAITDLSGLTVLPGFINTHMHLDLKEGSNNPVADAMQSSELDHLMQDAINAREMLKRGFTSARTLGSLGEDAALKRGIDRGAVPGPRLWVALEQLGATGSVADRSTGFDENLSNPHWARRILDSPDQAAFQVRDRKKRGADLIKIMVSGAVTSLAPEGVAMQRLSDEEIRAVVKAARELNMKVAAHAYGPEAIKAAVAGGVSSIEHGSYADEAALRAMKEKGVYLVPTLTIFAIQQDLARTKPELFNPVIREKTLALGDTPWRMVTMAHKIGVKIAFGSDAVLPARLAEEFGHYVRAGLTPMEAIQTATTNAADLIGASDRIGSIQPGRFADLVAVAGDPLKDVSILTKLAFVMKGGAVVRDDIAN
ncbi:MAG: amidohydrolase family protein [Pseudomonadota bacterium]